MKLAIYYVYAAFCGRPLFSKLNKLFYNLALRGMGVYNYQNMRISGELWFIKHVLMSAGENLIIFDIGANIGSYSKEILLQSVSVRQIYAFEPHSNTYQKLLKNTVGYPVNAVNLGMSDHIGPATLHDRADYNGSSHASLSSAIFSEVYRVKTKSETIDLTTVDEFCRLNHIDCIDLLKIDVEGYELNVLKGAKGMLNSRRVRFIQFEFTQLNSSIGVFFKDFYDLLVENYQIFRLLPHGIEPINAYNPTLHEIFGYQNFVCIPRK